MGSVSVLMVVAPATSNTAPNSPMAFDQVMTVPARSPDLAIGRVTWKNAPVSVQPSVFATFSYLGLTVLKADRKIRII
ncbi:MAG: hypothetical protein A4E42_02075 [Methanoregulaceae archaeon PtaU1.Bin222]|nr:MAG: hypothetical protein A4E42_02075 [Methanoregulaceae archaeon PtaU1.Bin222]